MVDAGACQPKTLLGNALKIAADDLIANGFSGGVDEEIATAALLGMITSNIAWCSSFTMSETLPPMSWVHYSKNKKDDTSESYSGADFAIVIKLSPLRYRAAIFQAKRSKSRKLNFKYHQISPAVQGFAAEPQFLRLSKHGLRILAACRPRQNKTTPTFKELDFLHYLVFDKSSCPCSAITEFEDKYIELIAYQRTATPGDTKDEESAKLFWTKYSEKLLYSDASLRIELGELLVLGADNASNSPAKGWLELKGFRQASEFIKSTKLLMDVFETSPIPNMKPTVSGGAIPHGRPGPIRQSFVSNLQKTMIALKASSQDHAKKVGPK